MCYQTQMSFTFVVLENQKSGHVRIIFDKIPNQVNSIFLVHKYIKSLHKIMYAVDAQRRQTKFRNCRQTDIS